MRFFLTIVFALFASMFAAGCVALGLAEWTRANEAYILVFMAIAPVALLAAMFLTFATTRTNQSGAINKTAKALIVIVVFLFAVGLMLSFLGGSSITALWNEIKLTGALAVSCVTIIAAQWLIFRRRST